MSMRMDITYGYGFDPSKVKADRLVSFIKKHKEAFVKGEYEEGLFNEIISLTENNYDSVFDILEEYEGNHSYTCTPYAAISEIITSETDVRFECDCGEYDTAIMFTETYPWHLTEKERKITPEAIDTMLIPYMKELGLGEEEIGSCRVEHWG